MTLPFNPNLPQGYASYAQYFQEAIEPKLYQTNPDLATIYNEANKALPDDLDEKKEALKSPFKPRPSYALSEWRPKLLREALRYASNNNNRVVLLTLLTLDLNPNEGESSGADSGQTALLEAIESNNQVGLKLLLLNPTFNYSLYTDAWEPPNRRINLRIYFFQKQESSTLAKILAKNLISEENIAQGLGQFAPITPEYPGYYQQAEKVELLTEYLNDPIGTKEKLHIQYFEDLSSLFFIPVLLYQDCVLGYYRGRPATIGKIELFQI